MSIVSYKSWGSVDYNDIKNRWFQYKVSGKNAMYSFFFPGALAITPFFSNVKSLKIFWSNCGYLILLFSNLPKKCVSIFLAFKKLYKVSNSHWIVFEPSKIHWWYGFEKIGAISSLATHQNSFLCSIPTKSSIRTVRPRKLTYELTLWLFTIYESLKLQSLISFFVIRAFLEHWS